MVNQDLKMSLGGWEIISLTHSQTNVYGYKQFCVWIQLPCVIYFSSVICFGSKIYFWYMYASLFLTF